MDQTKALAVTSGLLIGWLIVGLVTSISATISAILIALVLGCFVIAFRVFGRPDAPFLGVGIIVGTLITFLLPAISPAQWKELAAVAFLVLAYHV